MNGNYTIIRIILKEENVIMEEKDFNFKSRKESDVLKYIEMAQEQQKNCSNFVKN